MLCDLMKCQPKSEVVDSQCCSYAHNLSFYLSSLLEAEKWMGSGGSLSQPCDETHGRVLCDWQSQGQRNYYLANPCIIYKQWERWCIWYFWVTVTRLLLLCVQWWEEQSTNNPHSLIKLRFVIFLVKSSKRVTKVHVKVMSPNILVIPILYRSKGLKKWLATRPAGLVSKVHKIIQALHNQSAQQLL